MDCACFQESKRFFILVRTAVSRHDPRAARPIGIVTNGPTEVQRAKLELLGVDRLVDFVLVSENSPWPNLIQPFFGSDAPRRDRT